MPHHGRIQLGGALVDAPSMSVAHDLPPTYLDVPTEVCLRDVAKLNARVVAEVAAGSQAIHLVGVQSLSYGSRIALEGLSKRLARMGVRLDILPR